jgi:regulatory protein
VPPTAIKKALEGLDEAESAYRAAEHRVRRLSHLDEQAFRRRVGGFLQRRGFAYDVVRETVERLWLELQEARAEELL